MSQSPKRVSANQASDWREILDCVLLSPDGLADNHLRGSTKKLRLSCNTFLQEDAQKDACQRTPNERLRGTLENKNGAVWMKSAKECFLHKP